jgi:cysteinyl-tRNA synthetase
MALKAFPKKFEAAMDDDFNSALAIGEMQQLRAVVNAVLGRGISRSSSQAVMKLFRRYGEVLGIFQVPPKEWKSQVTIMPETGPLNLTGSAAQVSVSLSEETINKLVEERAEARRQKNWARSDEIRKQLADAGVILEDRPDGTARVKR